MKSPLLVILFSFFIVSLTAQIDTKVPDWVTPVEVKNIPVNKNDVTGGYYYSLLDEQYNTITKQNYYHYAKVILSEDALTTASQIEFTFDPSYQKAALHFIRIVRGNLVIDKTKGLDYKILNEENDRSKGLLYGTKTFYANLSDVRKGDIIEYGFSIKGYNPILAGYFNFTFPFAYSEAVGHIYYRVVLPKEIKLFTREKNTTINPVIEQTTDTEYVWEINNPTAIKMETGAPSWYDPYPTVQVTNLKDWTEVKQHCRSIFKLPAYNETGLKAIVDSVSKISPAPISRITMLIDFVQKHIRYSGNENGIYSNVPRTPDLVLKNRFGDCKEKSVLLNELLKLIEIDAHPVLINTSLKEKTSDRLPGINAFDHCISSFTFENKLYYIDPTISYQAGNFKLRILPAYGTGMILDDKPETFTTIDRDLSSSTKVLENFKQRDSANMVLKVTSTFTGTEADITRSMFRSNSVNDIQDSYKKFYNKYGDEIQVLDTISYTDNEESNTLVMVENYLIKNFWGVNDSLLKGGQKDFLPYALNYKLVYGNEATRKDPLQLEYPLNYTQIISVEHTKGWNITDESFSEKNNFFDYSFNKKVEGIVLTLTYNYSNRAEIIQPNEYLTYKSKMDLINKNIVLSIQDDPHANDTKGFNWLLLLIILSGLALASTLVWHLNSHEVKSSFEKRYHSIGGWLVVVGIGVFVSPLSYILILLREWGVDKNVNYYYYFFHENSFYFSPVEGCLKLLIIFSQSFLLVYSVFIVTIFSQKRAAFRFHFSIYKFAVLLLSILNIVVVHMNNTAPSIESRRLFVSEIGTLVGVIISVGIWVPYVWYSERSRHTFTDRISGDEPSELFRN